VREWYAIPSVARLKKKKKGKRRKGKEKKRKEGERNARYTCASVHDSFYFYCNRFERNHSCSHFSSVAFRFADFDVEHQDWREYYIFCSFPANKLFYG